MVKVWVRLIESGKKTLGDVPKGIYDEVYSLLVEDGFIEV